MKGWAQATQDWALKEVSTLLLCLVLLFGFWASWRLVGPPSTPRALEVVEYPDGTRIYRALDERDAEHLARLVNAASDKE